MTEELLDISIVHDKPPFQVGAITQLINHLLIHTVCVSLTTYPTLRWGFRQELLFPDVEDLCISIDVRDQGGERDVVRGVLRLGIVISVDDTLPIHLVGVVEVRRCPTIHKLDMNILHEDLLLSKGGNCLVHTLMHIV